MTTPSPIIPREVEAEKLRANITKGQPTLLLGDIGIGKTVLLRQVAKEIDKAIYIDSISPLKSAVLELSSTLHQRGELQIEGVQAEYLPWEDIEKKLARQTIRTLLGLITQNLSGKGYVLCLDALENATPTMAQHIGALMEHVTVVGAMNHKKSALKKLWWGFETLEIPPLTRTQSQELLWTLIDKTTLIDAALFERTVLNQANGNPLVITQLTEQAQKESDLTVEQIRGLNHEGGSRFIDITPLFFIVGMVAVAARFFALGTNSTELYILAGVFGGVFMGLRYFVYRAMREGE